MYYERLCVSMQSISVTIAASVLFDFGPYRAPTTNHSKNENGSNATH